jgi:hypothetical protein
MKRLIILGFASLCVIAMFGWFVSLRCGYCRSLRDIVSYALFAMDDATSFSPQYSESKFRIITKGMSKADVLASIGEPLEKDPTPGRDYRELWRFSKAPTGRNYWFRVVLFDASGRVVSTEAKYFVD